MQIQNLLNIKTFFFGGLPLCIVLRETHLWWFKGIVCRKVDCEEEHSALVWTVTLTERSKREGVKTDNAHLDQLFLILAVNNTDKLSIKVYQEQI